MRSGTVDIVENPGDALDADEQTAETESTPEVITVVGEDPTPSPTPMPIYEEEAIEDNIVNILLVGTDSRSETDAENSEGRSDSMMLASLNKSTGKITLVSFMRDARVKRIGTKGTFSFSNKLNGAYRGGYGGGGPGELINTINYNFDLDIQEYVCIGFDGFATLIDQIGGLDVDLDQAEINFINDRITGDHELEPDIVKNADTISAEPGIVHLNGAQALIYARNRHTGLGDSTGNDFDRVGRQQKIIELVYEKIKNEMSAASVYALITFACDYVSTNMSIDTMTSVAKTLLATDFEFVTTSVPEEGSYSYYVDETTGVKTDQMQFNITKAATALHELLYGAEETPEPTPTPTPTPTAGD